MAGQNKVPERLVNFTVFDENDNRLGVATVDLPEIALMTDTVSGSGIAGEIDTPVLGHYQPMTATLHWRTIEAESVKFLTQKSHQLQFRGSQQVYDAGQGALVTVPVRAVMKLTPKRYALGSLEPGATVEGENEFEVTYIKLFVDGDEVLEIDKYNFISKINGEDSLESVRQDLGLN